jgi:hypothetical protein
MTELHPVDLDLALLDPAAVFPDPESVVGHPDLTDDEKVRILRRWELDARELEVADDENMLGGEPDVLDRVAAALRQVAGEVPRTPSAPNRQGYREQ